MAHKASGDREVLIFSLIYSNKLAYLQLIIVLDYESSPLKRCERGYLNQILANNLKKRVNEFIFRTRRILFKSFRRLVLQNTSSYICSISK